MTKKQTEPLVGLEAEFFPPEHLAASDDEDEASWRTCRNVADALEEHLGRKFTVPRAPKRDDEPSSSVSRQRWLVTPDYSLDPITCALGTAGVEVTSPPLPVSEAAAVAHELCAVVDGIGGLGGGEAGFHINVSVPDIERLNPLVLGMAVPEMRILSNFCRADYNRCRFRTELVARLAEGRTTDMADPVLTSKATFLNLDTWRAGFGYVEFQHAGGYWHASPPLVLDAIHAFVDATATAVTLPADRVRRLETLVEGAAAAARSLAAWYRERYPETYSGVVHTAQGTEIAQVTQMDRFVRVFIEDEVGCGITDRRGSFGDDVAYRYSYHTPRSLVPYHLAVLDLASSGEFALP